MGREREEDETAPREAVGAGVVAGITRAASYSLVIYQGGAVRVFSLRRGYNQWHDEERDAENMSANRSVNTCLGLGTDAGEVWETVVAGLCRAGHHPWVLRKGGPSSKIVWIRDYM